MRISEIAQKSAVYLAHPYLSLPDECSNLNQDEVGEVYTFLRKNRVILRVANYYLDLDPNMKRTRIFVEKIIRRHERFARTCKHAIRLRRKIIETAKALVEKKVDIIFIKAFNDFPLDSSNFDILVRKKDLIKAKKTLEHLGYKEIAQYYEPYKWLFRKVDDDVVISVHIHIQVAWEGIKFVDCEEIWKRYREIEIENLKIGFPSPEHHLLITLAHAFLENRCLKLCDLIYMVETLQSGNKIDWNYVADWTISDNWFEVFYTSLRLTDHVYESLYKRRLVKEEVYDMLAKKGEFRDQQVKKVIDLFDNKKLLPLNVPSTMVIFPFIKKVLKDQRSSSVKRIRKITSLFWNYAKRRIPLRRELSTFVVCFSGQDGTGKTTHGMYLRNELQQKIHVMNDALIEPHFRIKYVWSRGIGLSIDPFMRIVRRLLLGSVNPSRNDKYLSKRERILEKEPIRTLWAYVMLADELLQLLMKVKMPLLLRQMVICDRYTYDVLIDVKCDLNKNVGGILKKFVESLAPRPEIVFITDAKPVDIMKRKNGSKYDSVECKRSSYLSYLRDEKFKLIDTSKDLQQNKKEILSTVMRALML